MAQHQARMKQYKSVMKPSTNNIIITIYHIQDDGSNYRPILYDTLTTRTLKRTCRNREECFILRIYCSMNLKQKKINLALTQPNKEFQIIFKPNKKFQIIFKS